MKTILYNSIFINPQAYYVFPRLTRYLQPDNESTSEPANYIGTIEVEVIAYGDTTLKRTYTNTDSIDLSEFKNTWIRISLFTKVGSCVLGEWKIGNMESDLPYIDPEVLASLKAVVIVGNKTNNDSDRAIVKNLVDPDNPFVISNAAYTEGSGYADKGSPYYGAFVTDGINDLITSTKTVQEMGITDEVTVVSMIHQIDLNSTYTIATTNYIENSNSREHVRSDVYNYGKTGIYGYSASLINNTKSDIKNILGDEADYYVKSTNSLQTIFDAKFSVVGRISELTEASQVAWYWTIIANKVLTTDQINQVIAYFNLDRTLNPDILCNTIKQGITNENHAEFGDKLIDFSGNGRDIQLNNLAWDGDSGIGKYNYPNWKVTATIANTYSTIVNYPTVNGTYSINVNGVSELMQSIGLHLEVKYTTSTGTIYNDIKQDGVYSYILPDGATDLTLRFGGIPGIVNEPCNITITQIPSHAGALCLDGVNDFGKVTGMPVYKDYTFIIDRQIISIGDTAGIVASKSEDSTDVNKQGAFLFEYLGAPNNISAWSFYKDNGKVANTDFTRGISYQSTYSYNGKDLTVGTSKDSDKLWLGTIRDRDSRFFNGAIYSLMSFPYSMSEFLIERQLRKHKLGTLYPDMVEFRPIVKSNNKWDIIEIWQGDKSLYRPTVNDDKTGIYLKKDSTIGIYVKPYVGQKVSEIVYNGVSYTDLKLNSNGFYYKVVPITKSPQKIGITIEQDENYVLFNPVINSNYDNYKLTFHLREYEKLINIGDYIPKGTYIRANLYLKNNIDELVTFTFNGVNIDYAKSPVLDTAYNIRQIYNYDSPQEVNITIDEYIRYEDIVQPYPVLLRFNDENGNEVSWGGKFRVGSTITRIGSAADSNLLPNIYNIFGLLLNDNQVTSSKVIVEKTMVFKAKSAYIFDNNEPNCILSPRLLRIPNSSYKILGHIPDISGHGNHGKINNSAYAGMSGANGYTEQEFSKWKYNIAEKRAEFTISNDVKLNIAKVVMSRAAILYTLIGDYTTDSIQRYRVTGVDESHPIVFGNDSPTDALLTVTTDGEYEVNWKTYGKNPCIFTTWTGDCDITIEQIGEYEGAYCLDGVDDFVTIPTMVGGKQVLMKVNWDSPNTSILYDQRGYNNEFAIYNGTNDSDGNPIPAYQGRNNGQTYIDGILNSNIKASELRAITHNITITNELSSGANKTYPIIGSSKSNAYFGNMALYDFMLFDEISTDDKILELNEYVGIEAKVELPPYYWDAYGKTNLDADKATIQQRGTAVGDYDLTNHNHAYEGMSGYNGYPVVFGANKTWEVLSSVYSYTSDVTSTTIHVTMVKNAGTGLLFSYVKKDGALTNIKEIPAFRVTIKGLEGNSKFGYRYLATEDATGETFVYLGNGTHELAKSFAPTEALLDLTRNAWVGIFITPMVEGEVVFDCDITIEVLPEYENGLVYDGIEDYSVNTNIPALTDYTYICKRTILNIPSNGATLLKGAHKANGGAFIADYSNKWQFNFGQYNIIQSIPDGINWQTSSSFNGTSINRGTNTDDKGITIGRFSNGYANMVLYKLILYPKTIPLLQINFLKNLMERDEIIDLNNPIFIQE